MIWAAHCSWHVNGWFYFCRYWHKTTCRSGCIYLEQTLKFRSPVFVGQEVVTTVTVTDINERRRRATLKTVCECEGKVVVTGEATIMLPAATA
ncbi:thioesterase family protein [Marinomonas sp. GJ51-6]|uniref:thioesterase family protein n=1 Tax=Marinomonas sp. GJ51-6 TaxID=2992802 RepID=UPI0039779488